MSESSPLTVARSQRREQIQALVSEPETTDDMLIYLMAAVVALAQENDALYDALSIRVSDFIGSSVYTLGKEMERQRNLVQDAISNITTGTHPAVARALKAVMQANDHVWLVEKP